MSGCSLRGYQIFLHWLNPGYRDHCKSEDSLRVISYVLNRHSLVGIRDGKIALDVRVNELREFIRGWAEPRGLIQPQR